MSILNFGPATITHEGEDLGKTIGGGSLTFHEQVYRSLRSQEQTRICTGGEGVINLFVLEDEVLITDDHKFLDYGEVIINAEEMTITLASCKIDFVAEIQFGTLNQFGWALRLDFKQSTGANPYVYSVE
jgi:hypothetical protein